MFTLSSLSTLSSSTTSSIYLEVEHVIIDKDLSSERHGMITKSPSPERV